MEFMLNGPGCQLERGICWYIVSRAALYVFVFEWVVGWLGVLPGQEVKYLSTC